MVRSIATCVLFLIPAMRAASGSARVVVGTENGQLAGKINATLYQTLCKPFPPLAAAPFAGAPNVAAFLGVPYAAAPVGENRFRPPQHPEKWSGVLDAKKPGAVCAQVGLDALVKLPSWIPEGDEDCLFLNIWAPSGVDGSIKGSRPVLVFLHGGGFLGGSGYSEADCTIYNGQDLAAAGDVVMVTLNYRLGVFGFLADADLKSESGTTGNYGLQDQRAALTWVQRNIAAFGGDPARVTVMGESAGAASVLHHMISPLSRGLFAQGIVESSYDVTWSLTDAYAAGRAFSDEVGCKTVTSRVDCLRKASTHQLMRAENVRLFADKKDKLGRLMFFGPVSDGTEFPENVSFPDLFKNAKVEVPMLIGSNLNETNLFDCTGDVSGSMSQAELKMYVQQQIQAFAPVKEINNTNAAFVDDLLQLYPGYSSRKALAMAIRTDIFSTSATRRFASAASAHGAPVYRYLFARPPRPFSMFGCLGTPHISELFLLFFQGFPSKAKAAIFGDETEIALADSMVQAWMQFVKHGNPGPAWQKWNDETEPTLRLSDTLETVNRYHREACKVLDTVAYNKKRPHQGQSNIIV